MVARLVYLGTPELAVAPLRALVAAGHDIELVVSRAARRRGRGTALSPSPVKAAALELGLAVTDRLDAIDPAVVELGVVVAYGRIIPADLLEQLPMVNLHFSLLPRWRGAAPVERAILAGDEVTGVSLMALDEGLDTGPVYETVAVPVDGADLPTLAWRLVEAGTELLVHALAGGVAGLPAPVPQQGDATYAEKLSPSDFELHFDAPTDELLRLVRLGRAWTRLGGRRLRVLAAEGASATPTAPGTLEGELVSTADGALALVSVQPEGGRPMRAADWRRGLRADGRLVLGDGDNRVGS